MNSVDTANQKAVKVSRTTGVNVVVTPPDHCFWGLRRYGCTQKGYDECEKSLNAWAKEFEEFLRDHRSRDGCPLDVVREVIQACSLCGNEWEPATDDRDRTTYCASCGAPIDYDERESDEDL